MGFKRSKLAAICIFLCERHNRKSHANSHSLSHAHSFSQSHAFSITLAHSDFGPAHASGNGNCEVRY